MKKVTITATMSTLKPQGNTVKYVALICLLALAFNYIVYDRMIKPLGLAVKLPYIDWSNDSNVKANHTRTLFDDKKHAEVLKSLRDILLNRSVEVQMKPIIVQVLKQLVPGLRDPSDVDLLLTGISHELANKTTSDVTPSSTRPLCPSRPDYLKGALGYNQTKLAPEMLEKLFPDLKPGGHHEPSECRPSEKLAIIIPYRNRFEHLLVLLNNLIPVLVRQLLDFTIFVIEQDPPTTFNRGTLFNVGFLEALKSSDFDCFIFHDVDMIPLNDLCLYRCAGHPRHLTVGVSKWKYRMPYSSYFGGVVALTRHQYETINGNSNLYFGWGGEDDDLEKRVTASGFKILRFPVDICTYEMIKHGADLGNTPNPKRVKLLNSSTGRMPKDGLNSTVYQVTKYDKKHLYTWINVFINITQVMQTHGVEE